MRFDRSGRLAAAPATSTVTAAATAAAALLLLLAPQLSPLPARAAEAPPDVIVHGEEPRDDFGWAVCPAGDVNGDGEPDLLVTCL
ncbi:MAG: integrin alpha, partial [Candidatus Eisenbacteria bacterium]|nr:integrin alpha [Candidatus Eisenbacteria bacterium]